MENSFFPGAKDELMNVVQPVFFFFSGDLVLGFHTSASFIPRRDLARSGAPR